jgi:hypothetical protein
MTYVIKRSNKGFPSDLLRLENNIWYNIWRKKSPPFNTLQINDKVLIRVGENTFREARISTLVKHRFSCRDGLMSILTAFSYSPHEGDVYWFSKLEVESGVILAYKFSVSSQRFKIISENRIRWFRNGWGVLK